MLKKWLKYYLPVLAWMGLIFVLSSVQGDGEIREVDFWFYIKRKGAHVFEYFVLALLLLRAFDVSEMTKREKIMSALIFPLAYAMTDEFHQQFVFGREGKLSDVGIDFVGVVLAVILWGLWRKRKMKKQMI